MKLLTIIIIFLCCQVPTYSNVVWFVSSQNVETFGRITGLSNEGKDVDYYFQVYNGRYLQLDPGHYVVYVRHPSIRGTESFSGVFKQYVVKSVENKRLITKSVTMLYPANSVEFYVKEKEERVKIEIPIQQKLIEEMILDSQSIEEICKY